MRVLLLVFREATLGKPRVLRQHGFDPINVGEIDSKSNNAHSVSLDRRGQTAESIRDPLALNAGPERCNYLDEMFDSGNSVRTT